MMKSFKITYWNKQPEFIGHGETDHKRHFKTELQGKTDW